MWSPFEKVLRNYAVFKFQHAQKPRVAFYSTILAHIYWWVDAKKNDSLDCYKFNLFAKSLQVFLYQNGFLRNGGIFSVLWHS